MVMVPHQWMLEHSHIFVYSQKVEEELNKMMDGCEEVGLEKTMIWGTRQTTG